MLISLHFPAPAGDFVQTAPAKPNKKITHINILPAQAADHTLHGAASIK
jgi:hypothetical protein